MTKTKQFWTLFKFQTTINPFIVFMLIALISPLFFIGGFSNSYHPNLYFLLNVQNLFFVGILGLWTLAPEMAQLGGAAATAWGSGTEFLLTRAIDRPILYRARAVFFCLLVFVTPLTSLLCSLQNPDLKVTEYSAMAQKQCLQDVPGSALEPNPSGNHSPLIRIPRGNVLIEEWHFEMFIVSALLVQALLLLLYPFKYRAFIFYALFMDSILVTLLADLHYLKAATPPIMERLFFIFAAHQMAVWILTALVLILGQLWCERRFTRLEQ
jgi:hypothetical protein